jgi:hypothetical protein
MARASKRIDLEQEPEPVRVFLSRIHDEGVDVVVAQGGRPVLSIVHADRADRADESPPRAAPLWPGLTPSERATRLERLYGSWKEVDGDAIKAGIAEGRTFDRRPPIEL